ncbi:flagellar motor protein MotB [Oceanobacillus kapialis]|uniref:Flagellar motor protein MotB n=1 Tax=Oceanobacillus kapialis TaxID=481353 RepID=A0ABW5Q128_9BACI
MSRKKKHHENHVDESWLLPYSDLLTLLVALFIVLFAMSEIDSEKYQQLSTVFKEEFAGGSSFMEESNAPNQSTTDVPVEDEKEKEPQEQEQQLSKQDQELEELETIQQQINRYIQSEELEDVFDTELTDEGLLLTILNDISFDSGSAVVKAEGQKLAQDVSELLYTDPPHQIVISGHADDRPVNNADFASNWELSVMRAINFMGLILENDKLDPGKFSAKGFGEHQPIAPNDSEANRAKNRRVEVLILPNYDITTEEQ